MRHLVTVPDNLTLGTSIEFVNLLDKLPEAEDYIFDFRHTRRIEPFALLFVSSELQRVRRKKRQSNFTATNYNNCSYAAHMGFFQAFGMPYGEYPREGAGNNTYLPIEILEVSTIKEEAAKGWQVPAQFLNGKARNMSEMLTRTSKGPLYDTIAYSLREILRNVIEHSESTRLGICAQYWPSRNKVSLAILDRGKGIFSSLSANPNLKIESDLDALRLSLPPGISGTAFEGAYIDPDDAWANSGYGLYMTSQICKQGGSFFILSGNKGLFLSENSERAFDAQFDGTALNLSFDTHRLTDLELMLESYRQTSGHKGSLKPSTASTKIM